MTAATMRAHNRAIQKSFGIAMPLPSKAALLFAGIGSISLPSVEAGTIYLCRAYSGGEFWSSAHCSQQQSLFLRSLSVPDGMPFNQQVELGQQVLASLAQRRAAEEQPSSSTSTTKQSASAECTLLDEKIRRLDALARQPLRGAQQDRITADRNAARSRQFQLRCPQPAVR